MIDEPLKLEPGLNTFRLKAVTQGVPPSLVSHAEVGREMRVHFQPPALPPEPEVRPETLVLVPEEADGLSPQSRRIETRWDDLVDVDVPRVRLEGRIVVNSGQFVRADWRYAARPWEPLAASPAGPAGTYRFRQEIGLIPARQDLQIRAWVANKAGEETKGSALVRIQYRPLVPTVGEITLKPRRPTPRPGTGGPPPLVDLTVRLKGRPEHHPVDEALVFNNEEPLRDIPVALDLKAGSLTAKVPLTRVTINSRSS